MIKLMSKIVRLLQLGFLMSALWFVFWTHIYPMTASNVPFGETLNFQVNMIFYAISFGAIIYIELWTRRLPTHVQRRVITPSTSLSAMNTVNSIQENDFSSNDLNKSRGIPSNAIAFGLLAVGIVLLLISVLNSLTTVAFVGLCVTFWGILFLFARSTKFVKSNLLGATAHSFYTTIDRMVDDFNYSGKAFYVPSYPQEAYLPEYMKGLKESVLFISAKDETSMPNIEELAKKRFVVKNPEGICITPPGFRLLNLFEKELKMNFSTLDSEGLYDSLQIIILKNLELAKSFEIETEKELIHAKIGGSVYMDLYSNQQNLRSVRFVGDPLVSAVASAIAKKTGKLVTIAKSEFSVNLKTIDVWYQTVEG